MKYTIITGGPVIVQDFKSLDEVKAYVEKYAPMKRGWTRTWESAPEGRELRMRRFNSKGKLQRNLDIYVRQGDRLQHLRTGR